MGAAISVQLLKSHRDVTVWNRTREKCERIRAAGARVANTAAEAIQFADLVIAVTASTNDLDIMLQDTDCQLAGKDLVSFITATPMEARALASLVERSDGCFLNGSIQSFPRGIGQTETQILFGGDKSVWERRLNILKSLAGASIFTGDDPALPNVLDTAVMGCFILVSEAALLEGAAYAAKEGVSVETLRMFWPAALKSIAGHVERVSKAILENDLSTDCAPLRLYERSFELFNRAMLDAGASNPLTAAALRRIKSEVAAGHGELSLAVLHRH